MNCTFKLATHGVKRSVSHSWEGDNHKISKHKHQTLHLPSEQLTNNTKYKNRNSEPQKANGVYYDDGHVKVLTRNYCSEPYLTSFF